MVCVVFRETNWRCFNKTSPMHMGFFGGGWVFVGSSCLLLIYLHYGFFLLSMDDLSLIVYVVFSDMNQHNLWELTIVSAIFRASQVTPLHLGFFPCFWKTEACQGVLGYSFSNNHGSVEKGDPRGDKQLIFFRAPFSTEPRLLWEDGYVLIFYDRQNEAQKNPPEPGSFCLTHGDLVGFFS